MKDEFTKQIFSSLDTAFDDVFKGSDQETWIEDPVTFRQFVLEKQHMDFPTLSERQLAVTDFIFGDDPKKTFDNKNTLAILSWGKGSGKDQISALMMCYIVYVLLCLESPQRFFGLPEGEAIDLLNIAKNSEQASSIFFEKLRQRVLHWEWLKSKYTIKVSGIYLGQLKDGEFIESAVVVTKNGIMFPKSIRAFSGHSEEASQEGKNILFFVGDEISAFDDLPTTTRAEKIFNMLRTSAVSRFGQRWKGALLSFPRYENDFILRMHAQAEGELHWFADKAATWQVKPAHLFKDYPEKYFEFEGEKIPLEFQQEFQQDPDDARGKFMCQPVSISSAFIEQPEKIDWCIDKDRKPLVETEEYFDEGLVKKRILAWHTDSVVRDYIITVDLGLRSDSAALSLFHRNTDATGDYLIQDFVSTWMPDKSKNILVSLVDVESFILAVKEKVNLVKVMFDQWQSALMVQTLNKAGVSSDVYYLKIDDYKNFKESAYAGKVRLLDYPTQTREIKRLILTRANRVDHPVGESKDCADTIVGAHRILINSSMNNGISGAGIGGTFIEQDNVFTMGGNFIK